MKFSLLILATLVFVSSCDDAQKITQLYSYPEWRQDLFIGQMPENSFYLFNLGSPSKGLLPTKILKGESQPKALPHEMPVAGQKVINQYLQIIRERFKDSALVISHSDVELSNHDKSKVTLTLNGLKTYNLNGVLLTKGDLPSKSPQEAGLHHGPAWFNTNILEIKTGEPTTLYESQPFKYFEKQSTYLLGISSYKKLSPKERNEITGFYFQDPVTTVLRYKGTFAKSPDSIVALYYDGALECTSQLPQKLTPFEKMPKFQEVCKEGSELENILKRLPPDSIDLVVTNNESLTGALFNRTPIIGAGGSPTYLSSARITRSSGKVNLKESLLLPPIKLCHKMFAGTQDCTFTSGDGDVDEERFDLMEISGFGLIPARFLGREIKL